MTENHNVDTIHLVLRSFAVAAVGLALTGCSARQSESIEFSRPYLIENGSLENLLRVSKMIYSGGQPQGAESFEALTRLGVKTVVSVDGAAPDVETAFAHGLRYVHIPMGYDGVEDDAGRSLARLVREAEGPFYVHCHHGLHRAPVAAAIASIAAGTASSVEARDILLVAGTSVDYGGLWRAVEVYRSPASDAELPELVEVAQVNSFAAAMAAVDRAYDNLKLCRDAGWTAPDDHPDLVPSQEALMLREGLRESVRTLDGDGDSELRKWLTEAEATARALETSLQRSSFDASTTKFEAVVESCTRCHAKYRD